MTNKLETQRRLAAEALENRTLMAGDIAASVQGGVLFLRGDAAANGVVIRNGEGGNLEVVGATAGGSATTINGATQFVAQGVTLGVSAALGAGNDVVRFANPAVEGVARPVAISGAVNVNTAAGQDRVDGRINNGGAVTFNLGAGHDHVSLGGSNLGTLVVNADPLPRNGETPVPGNDQVTLTSVRAARGAAIRTGAGDDVVQIRGNSAFAATLTVSTDDGHDRVEISGDLDKALAVGGALTVNAGKGNDAVTIERVSVQGALSVTAGDDDDLVDIEHAAVSDGIFAAMMGGDDTLSIRESSSSRAVLTGGLGDDALVLQDNVLDELIRVGF